MSAWKKKAASYCFQQIHIDVARNSTDDFNPFHDPNKWVTVRDNPYGGPIILAFQLEFLIEYLLDRSRVRNERELIARHSLNFANYQFIFADAMKPGEPFTVDISRSVFKLRNNSTLSNRVKIKKQSGSVLFGCHHLSTYPLYLAKENFLHLADLKRGTDISYIPDTSYFLKRKFMSTANAKNFISSSLGDQYYYFDEIDGRINFPDFMPVSLLSSALLEKDRGDNHNFNNEPTVYAKHCISVDQRLARLLQSNDSLFILVDGPAYITNKKILGHSQTPHYVYRCFGLLSDNSVLFRAEIIMVAPSSPNH